MRLMMFNQIYQVEATKIHQIVVYILLGFDRKKCGQCFLVKRLDTLAIKEFMHSSKRH